MEKLKNKNKNKNLGAWEGEFGLCVTSGKSSSWHTNIFLWGKILYSFSVKKIFHKKSCSFLPVTQDTAKCDWKEINLIFHKAEIFLKVKFAEPWMWFQLHFLSLGYLQEFLYWYQNKCIKSTFLWDDLLFTLRFLFVFLNCRGKGVLKKNQLEWKCFFGVIRNSRLGYSVMHSLTTDLRAWTLSVIYTANIRGTNKQKTEQNFLESSLFALNTSLCHT